MDVHSLFNKDPLDILLHWCQLIGIPVAIYVYWVNKKSERRDREYGTYNALDEHYVDYLKLCLENADLDVADTPRVSTVPLSADQRHRELIIFTILVALMERAFLMYDDKSKAIKLAQWIGWDGYIRDWCRRTNFLAALPVLASQFDSRFRQYLTSITGQSL